MRDFIKYALCLILGVILGFIIGSLGHSIMSIQWKGEIGPEPFINLVTGIVVAIFLSQSFQKFVDVKKSEHSLVTEPLKSARKVLGEMKVDFQTAYKLRENRAKNLQKFIDSHRSFSNYLTEAKETLTALQYKTEQGNCDGLQIESTLYKQVLTGGKPDEPFDSTDYSKHEKHYAALSKDLLEMILDIGRK